MEEGALYNAFDEANIALIPKPGKDNSHTQNHRAIGRDDEQRCEDPKQNPSKSNTIMH